MWLIYFFKILTQIITVCRLRLNAQIRRESEQCMCVEQFDTIPAGMLGYGGGVLWRLLLFTADSRAKIFYDKKYFLFQLAAEMAKYVFQFRGRERMMGALYRKSSNLKYEVCHHKASLCQYVYIGWPDVACYMWYSDLDDKLTLMNKASMMEVFGCMCLTSVINLLPHLKMVQELLAPYSHR